MSAAPFPRLADALSRDARRYALHPKDPPPYRRLAQALSATTVLSAPSDLAGLVRHVLRREAELHSGSSPVLLVPRSETDPRWPTKEIWKRANVDATDAGDFLRVTAKPWVPAWLHHQRDPAAGAFGEVRRRSKTTVPGDPFLEVWSGFRRYSSPGQKRALRAAIYAPDCHPGSTLCVVLPTGSGKSLVAHVPAFLASQRFGVSLMVVPTTALALDQERTVKERASRLGFAERIPERLAYYGEMEPEEKSAMLRRVELGQQPIVFLSPEALLTSFAHATYRAASKGYLKYLVIDEAHLVGQWGVDFRPAFQSLAGFRRDLLRRCRAQTGFVTILMTATLTEEGLDTLHTLFGFPGPFFEVPGVQLRPEPQFYAAYCSSEAERLERLQEAVWNLPRPIIVYTTKVKDTEQVYRCLRQDGYQRIAQMTGETPDEERDRIIRDWDAGNLDLVVATSAFGVGVDHPHVRSVVHACIPENLDRFYQEVGRGGRDGCESVSLTLYTKQDFRVATRLNERIITLERGFERWKAMFLEEREGGGDESDGGPRIIVPLDARPADLDFEGSENRAWNIRTLNLMARGGLIRLDWQEPPEREWFDTPEAYEAALGAFRATRCIEILDGAHLAEAHWNETIQPLRDTSLRRARDGYQAMKQLLRVVLTTNDRSKIDAILRQFYTVFLALPDRDPICFAPKPLPPDPPPVPADGCRQAPILERLAQGQATIGVCYTQADTDDALDEALGLSVHYGVRNLINIGDAVSAERLRQIYRTVKIEFFVETCWVDLMSLPRFPTALVLPRTWSGRRLASGMLTMAPSPHVLFFPVGTRDVNRQDRHLDQILAPVYSVRQYLREFQ